MPKSYAELMKVRATLEKHFKDVQDFEFTIQEGEALHAPDAQRQTHRRGRRSKFAVDMVKEKLIDWETAVIRVPADQLDKCSRRSSIALRSKKAQVHRHRPAGRPGRCDRQRSISMPIAPPRLPTKGEKVLLVRIETSPEDLRGMIAAEGILTARGGVSSHAALVARQMGKVCVCGAAALADRLQSEDTDGRTTYLQGRATSSPSMAPAATFTRARFTTAPARSSRSSR